MSASAYWPSAAEESEAAAHNEYFSRQPASFEETTELCEETCLSGRMVLPPGWYLVRKDIAGHDTFRVHEEGEIECGNAEKDERCSDFDAEQPEEWEEYLAPGYKEFYEVFRLVHDYRDAHFEEIGFFYAWKPLEKESERFGVGSANEPGRPPCVGADPVNCATGNQVETQTDLKVGGRGLGLSLTRSYNSLRAPKQKEPGSFGYGWTGSYSAHLELSYEGREATVYQDNGSTATFGRSNIEAPWTASRFGEACR
ncbi:MAG TPA: DUF6531 domain-containing protein [Solirubrobacteraceae bacterium]|nr:DUF6531 domain-containing protein [Solirubrobacteraceae bacterium]